MAIAVNLPKYQNGVMGYNCINFLLQQWWIKHQTLGLKPPWRVQNF